MKNFTILLLALLLFSINVYAIEDSNELELNVFLSEISKSSIIAGGIFLPIPKLSKEQEDALLLELLNNKTTRFDTDKLIVLSEKSLRILRNSIFARHGYIMKSNDLKLFFEKYQWYRPTKDLDEIILEEYEKYNVSLISKIENAKKTKINTDSDLSQYSDFKNKVDTPEISFEKKANCDIENGVNDTIYVLKFKDFNKQRIFNGSCIYKNEDYNGYEHKIVLAKHLPVQRRVYVRTYEQFPLGDLGFQGLKVFDEKGNELLNIPDLHGALWHDTNGYYVSVENSGCCGATNDTLYIYDQSGNKVLVEGGDGFGVTDLSPVNNNSIFLLLAPAGGEMGWGDYSKVIIISEDGDLVFNSKIIDKVDFWLDSSATSRIDENTIFVKLIDKYEPKEALFKYYK